MQKPQFLGILDKKANFGHFFANMGETGLIPLNLFYIFLSGGGGVGKTHTINGIIEYIKKHLKFQDQNPEEQPSILVCT